MKKKKKQLVKTEISTYHTALSAPFSLTPKKELLHFFFFRELVSFIKNSLVAYYFHSGVAACYDELMIYKYPLDDAAVKALSG